MRQALSASLGPSARMPGLDVLRAAAILWVLVYHAAGFSLAPTGSALVDSGWMAVDLFFVLSGYLIGGQLLRPLARGEGIDLWAFYLRRLLRTVPAYAVVVLIYFAVPSWREWKDIQPLWQFVTFSENLFIHIRPPKAFSHVWSLCVEEQFYLAFPLAAAMLSRRPRLGRLLAGAAGVALAGIVLRAGIWLEALRPLYGSAPDPYVWRYMERIYDPTWTRLDGLVAGVSVAAVQVLAPGVWRGLERRANLVLGVGLAGLAASFAVFRTQFPGFGGVVFGYPLLSASLALVTAAATQPRCLAIGRGLPGARPLALASYSLYLVHKMPMHWAAVRFHADPARLNWTAALAAGLATFAAGGALHLMVERPFLRLRDRLPRREGAPAAPAAVEPLTAAP